MPGVRRAAGPLTTSAGTPDGEASPSGEPPPGDGPVARGRHATDHWYRGQLRLQDGLCVYCGLPVWRGGWGGGWRRVAWAHASRLGAVTTRVNAARAREWSRATREHVVRRADGGSDDPVNLAVACAFCNGVRGEADPLGHRAAMSALAEAGLHPLRREAWQGRTARELLLLATGRGPAARSGR